MASVRDLLFMLPRRYEDRRMFDRYDSLSSGVPVCLRGRVVDVGWKGWGGRGGKGRGRYVEAVLADEQSLGRGPFFLPVVQHAGRSQDTVRRAGDDCIRAHETVWEKAQYGASGF